MLDAFGFSVKRLKLKALYRDICTRVELIVLMLVLLVFFFIEVITRLLKTKAFIVWCSNNKKKKHAMKSYVGGRLFV